MAIQCGKILLRKTIDNITFYQMDGKWYARKKSSLSGARVKKDPHFKRTMEQAGFFALGSKMGAVIYHGIPRENRPPGLYRQLAGMATRLLKAGKPEEDVVRQLQQLFTS